MKVLASIAVAATSLALTSATGLGAPIALPPPPDLAVDVWGDVKPSRLPDDRVAPVSVDGGFKAYTASGDPPPAIREVDLELDRHIWLTTTGLPVCHPSNVEIPIEQACRDSIVGKGSARFDIRFEEVQPILANARATVYSAPAGAAVAKFLVVLDLRIPVLATAVISVVVHRVDRGIYGFRAEAKVPDVAGGAGRLIELRLRIGKRWKYRDERYSLLSARCTNGRLQERSTFLFSDESAIGTTLIEPCGVSR